MHRRGVRGTELTIWAGTDGASQLIVDSGLVTVEAYGKTVELGPDEAVVVLNGEQPGEKFIVHREVLTTRNGTRDASRPLLADPLARHSGMRERLAYYRRECRGLLQKYLDVNARLRAEREQADEAEDRAGRGRSSRLTKASSSRRSWLRARPRTELPIPLRG